MKNFIYAFVLIIAIIFSAFILKSIYSLQGDSTVVSKGYQFNIPAKYGTRGFMNLSARWFTQHFQSEEIAVFQLPEDELALKVTGYKTGDGKHSRNIKGLIRVWDEATLENYQKPTRYKDLWRGSGPYSNREIHPYSYGKLFKVYREPNSKKIWTVLSQNPALKNPLPEKSFDFWVARCRLHDSFMPLSPEFTICNSYLFIDDIVVEFYLAEDNLETIEEIREVIAEKVLSWKSLVES